VLVAVLSSVIAAFFYIRVIVLMYMQDPAEALEVERAPVAAVGVAVPAALTLVFGVLPGLLFGLLHHAAVITF
jgi:NADH-quinone oxidoreductase subunit N